ncbi:aldehyde dehydrogenase [Nitrospinae bacterium]|nr:aldehyde dehydrogenase [Nitrospinota bacterium]
MDKIRKTRIAINGFGRIGRAIAKLNAQHGYFELALINDINPHVDNLAYLFKYDSTYGRFLGQVDNTESEIIINGHPIACLAHSSLRDVPWEDYSIDLIIDSSGVESNVIAAKNMVKEGGSVKVIVTHSSEETDHEIVMGVNDETLNSKHKVVSNSICDAQGTGNIMKWMDDEYGIEGGALTTLHPWLSYQNLVDGSVGSQSKPGLVWTDYSLGRASTDCLIPKNTTAMRAVERVLPNLKNKILSFSYRIPTNIVASADITLNLSQSVQKEELRDFLNKKSSCSPYVRTNTGSLTSLDYKQEEMSAVLDMQWLKVNANTVKMVLWYDNEWGYGARVLDLAKKLCKIC